MNRKLKRAGIIILMIPIIKSTNPLKVVGVVGDIRNI